MRKLLFGALLIIVFLPTLAFAQTMPKQTFEKARVVSVNHDGTKDFNGRKNPYQDLTLQILEGSEKDKQIHLEYGGNTVISENQKVSTGETVILTSIIQDNKTTYAITDRYRLPSILFITLVFFGLVVLLTGKKGIGSIAGLIISLLIISVYIVPQILNGGDPLMISIIGSLVIMLVTLYLAHGFNR